MKAILIARVSTEEQKEAGNSLPAQVARLEKYCQNRNLEVAHTCSFDESFPLMTSSSAISANKLIVIEKIT